MTRIAARLGGVELETPPGTGTYDDLAPPADTDSFCHIESGDGRTAYCGKLLAESQATCKLYEGESICPSCGLVTCPQCSVMSSLHDRLVDGEEIR